MNKQNNIGKRVQVKQIKKTINEKTNTIEEKEYILEGTIVGINRAGRKLVYIVEYSKGLAGTEDPDNVKIIETADSDEHTRGSNKS